MRIQKSLLVSTWDTNPEYEKRCNSMNPLWDEFAQYLCLQVTNRKTPTLFAWQPSPQTSRHSPPTKLKTYKAQLKRPKLNSSQSFPGRDSSLFPTENNHFCGKIHENRKILCSISKVQKLHNMQVKLIPIGSKYPKSSYPAPSKLKVGKGCSWASKPVTSTCAVRSHLGRWLQNHAASKFFRTLNTWIILFK